MAQFGTQQISASGVVGKSGDPVVVYGLEITSNGTAGSVVKLYNGTSVSGNLIWQGTGTVSKTVSPTNFPFGGIYFPAGCFVSMDANGLLANIQLQAYHTV